MSTNTYTKPVDKGDNPPTKADANMRDMHTSDSVQYNMNHLQDHGGAMVKSLSKLGTVNKKKAKTLGAKMAQQINDLANQVQGGTMATPLKHTGTTNGKSNQLGGGGRFKQLVNQGKSPALAAFIGRKKYGAKAMAKMAAKK